MGQIKELNQVNMIEDAINEYKGFTISEKEYGTDNLLEWISKDTTLSLLISKFSEISLDVKPFLKQNGLLV